MSLLPSKQITVERLPALRQWGAAIEQCVRKGAGDFHVYKELLMLERDLQFSARERGRNRG